VPRQRLQDNGFVLINEPTPRAEALRLAHTLGIPSGDIRDPRIVRELRPLAHVDANRNTLSSRYGAGPFPLHTETAYWRTPARYLLLRCVSPGASKRPTVVVPLSLRRLTRRQKICLESAVWVCRARPSFLCSILDGKRIRYDRECMKPASPSADLAAQIMSELVYASQPVEIAWCEGRLLIIDNFRCLHGRAAAAVPDPDRVLERIIVREA